MATLLVSLTDSLAAALREVDRLKAIYEPTYDFSHMGGLSVEEAEYMSVGKKVEAVKHARSRLGVDLRMALRFVENAWMNRATIGPPASAVMPQAPAPGGK